MKRARLVQETGSLACFVNHAWGTRLIQEKGAYLTCYSKAQCIKSLVRYLQEACWYPRLRAWRRLCATRLRFGGGHSVGALARPTGKCDGVYCSIKSSKFQRLVVGQAGGCVMKGRRSYAEDNEQLL